MAKLEKNINKIKFGFWPGLILPMIVFLLMYGAKSKDLSFLDYLNGLWQFQILIKLLTLCVLPNLLLFLYFIRMKYDMAARGVLMSTFVYAFLVIISKAF